MTMLDFEIMCGEHLIDPAVALENKTVVGAIHQNDMDALKDALETEF